MKTRVLDSWAVLEWISGRQPATDAVAKLFAESEAGVTRLFMSAINVGEVYYFGSSGESVGSLRVSALGLSEETVKLAAGGVEGALLVFPAVVDQRAAILMDHVADELFRGVLS